MGCFSLVFTVRLCNPLAHSLTCRFTYLLTCRFTYLPTYLLAYLPTEVAKGRAVLGAAVKPAIDGIGTQRNEHG